MVKILLINIRIYSNININEQTNFEYDFWAKVKALVRTVFRYLGSQKSIIVVTSAQYRRAAGL
jgi:hypothetical protein